MDATHQIGIIVGVRAGGGFVLLDALGREHYAHDVVELGILVARLTSDTDLPQYESDGAAMAALEAATIQIVSERVLPGYMRPVAPVLGRAAANAAASGVKKGWKWIEEIAARKKVKKAEERSREAEARARAKAPPPEPASAPRRETVESIGTVKDPPKAERPRPKRAHVPGSSLRFAQDRRAAGGKA